MNFSSTSTLQWSHFVCLPSGDQFLQSICILVRCGLSRPADPVAALLSQLMKRFVPLIYKVTPRRLATNSGLVTHWLRCCCSRMIPQVNQQIQSPANQVVFVQWPARSVPKNREKPRRIWLRKSPVRPGPWRMGLRFLSISKFLHILARCFASQIVWPTPCCQTGSA